MDEAFRTVMLVFGTRPEAIKMAPLVKELERHREFRTLVCVTGQHRSMLDQVLDVFGIKPDYDLNIMKAGQDLYDVTSRVLLGMRGVIAEARPDLVLVHGDTTTSMAAALAAFYAGVPVGHVEAGLRTRNLMSPWPEELNRQLTGRMARLNFAPTELGRRNLLSENVSADSIFVTGNTVIDALHIVVRRLEGDGALAAKVDADLRLAGYDPVRTESRRMVLVTGHRRENFGESFRSICRALKTLAETHPDVDFVYPMHLNPNVRRPIAEVFGENAGGLSNMFFIEPLEYLAFVRLMSCSSVVLTDSGGIQEEAPGLGKPVLVMRDTTERPEALDAGTVRLVGTDYDAIVNQMNLLLGNEAAYAAMSQAVNPYGDGHASERIAEIISRFFQ